MKVTFDTNTWQGVVRPYERQKDPHHADFQAVHDAIVDGRVRGFIVETVTTLEGIKKRDRAAYFAGTVPTTSVLAGTAPDAISASIGPNHGQHPGIHPALSDRLRDALDLGFRFLKVPRIGMASPPIVLTEENKADEPVDGMGERQDRTAAAGREIEARGVGKDQVEQIGKRIAGRTGKSEPWWKLLADVTEDEINEVAKAVAEWADGDSLAAHIGYKNDVFCTNDKAVGAGHSILNADNRGWLTGTYGVHFSSISELAADLPTK